jgi:hypothetical protein
VNIEATVLAWGGEKESAFYVSVTDGSTKVERVYCIESTLNQAEIEGIRFVLLSLPPRVEAIKIATDSYYLSGLLEKNGKEWLKTAETNTESVNFIRNLISKYRYEVIRKDLVEIRRAKTKLL